LRNVRDRPQAQHQDALLFLAWDSLIKLSRHLRRLDTSSDEMWSNLLWSFSLATSKIDLNRRDELIGRKLLNDTQHNTRAWYERQRDPQYFNPQDQNDLGEYPECRIPSAYAAQATAEFYIDRNWAINRLRRLVTEGFLERPDFQILLGCHIYGRSIEEIAVHLGIPYGVAKKRRQRAVKKLQKNAPSLSPNDPDSPLYQVERTTRREV